jgi:hypothetical protein
MSMTSPLSARTATECFTAVAHGSLLNSCVQCYRASQPASPRDQTRLAEIPRAATPVAAAQNGRWLYLGRRYVDTMCCTHVAPVPVGPIHPQTSLGIGIYRIFGNSSLARRCGVHRGPAGSTSFYHRPYQPFPIASKPPVTGQVVERRSESYNSIARSIAHK